MFIFLRELQIITNCNIEGLEDGAQRGLNALTGAIRALFRDWNERVWPRHDSDGGAGIELRLFLRAAPLVFQSFQRQQQVRLA